MTPSFPCGMIGYMADCRRYYVNFFGGIYDVRDPDGQVVDGSPIYADALAIAAERNEAEGLNR